MCHCFQAVPFGDLSTSHCSRAVAHRQCHLPQFEPGTPEADKRELLRMLEALGSDAVAIFTKN